jgi:hypothetical protein
MMFDKELARALSQEYSRRGKNQTEDKDAEKPELEKGDMLALAIAAVKVFSPFLLCLIAGVCLFTWLFLR